MGNITSASDLPMSTKSEIVLWTGFVVMVLFGIGWLVAAGFYSGSCGTCADGTQGIIVVPLGPGGQQTRCPNGHLPVCPKGAKFVLDGATAPHCAAPSATPGGAPIITQPLCPQCANGSSPQCSSGYELKSSTNQGIAAFQCVNKAVPSITVPPRCAQGTGSSQ
jgi:hypothetical protein